jgi:flagellar motility protein MotE (MotC chaperone)
VRALGQSVAYAVTQKDAPEAKPAAQPTPAKADQKSADAQKSESKPAKDSQSSLADDLAQLDPPKDKPDAKEAASSETNKESEEASADPQDEEEDGAQPGIKKELMDNLAKRRSDLEKRENDLVMREALLKAAEKEINQKYQELTRLRTKIEDLLNKQTDEEQKRIKSLVKIYEGMKPADAARIFDTLDLDVLVSVMTQMSERKLSSILAAMSAERARTITIMMAEQKQLPSLPGGQ